ncbi:uncharacterized protein LOC132394851 [Hypanus sabinus]|uniref:uncharacterized protein LOC132394851 n=1 Tax=Hypanus sabinus TaxID=79690 RepID=UPI0028C3B7F9|nr:uncharacterized protein LOC132394851 [Hypanus sabinus]
MASTQLDEVLSEDLTCPICLDFFSDPVSLECGHNFCRSCITQTWERKEKISCPECGEEFAERTVRGSRALANLSEKARKLNLKTKEKGDSFLCDEHWEELKLFCQTDEKLSCYSCRDAREHREHHFMPVNEAVEIYKALVKSALDSATEKKSLVLEMEHQQKQKISEIRDQSEVLEKHIVSEFSEIHQFLTGKEKALISDLQQEKEEVLEKMQKNLLEIQERLKSLRRELLKLQEQMEQKDIMLFLKEETWRNVSGNDEHQKLSVKGGFLNVEKFKGPFLETVWKEILDAFNPASVTLDVETANPRLEVSDDRKSVRLSGVWNSLPDTSKRFTDWAGVLGSEGFTAGRYYWEVEVEGNSIWSLGIAAESVERKGWVGMIPENGFWTIGRVGDRFYVNTSPGSPLPADSIPKKVRVCLSYELGKVSFYNADTKSHLHTFTGNKFTGKLYPFFWTGDENKWLRICSGSGPGTNIGSGAQGLAQRPDRGPSLESGHRDRAEVRAWDQGTETGQRSESGIRAQRPDRGPSLGSGHRDRAEIRVWDPGTETGPRSESGIRAQRPGRGPSLGSGHRDRAEVRVWDPGTETGPRSESGIRAQRPGRGPSLGSGHRDRAEIRVWDQGTETGPRSESGIRAQRPGRDPSLGSGHRDRTEVRVWDPGTETGPRSESGIRAQRPGRGPSLGSGHRDRAEVRVWDPGTETGQRSESGIRAQRPDRGPSLGLGHRDRAEVRVWDPGTETGRGLSLGSGHRDRAEVRVWDPGTETGPRSESAVSDPQRRLTISSPDQNGHYNKLQGQYDLVGITETWLQGDQTWEMNVQGYTCYHRDRNVGREGGVALLVRNEIQSFARGDIGSGEVESVWIELRNSKGKRTLMGVVYRPPNSSMDIGCKLNRELTLACGKGNVAVVMGDFNMQVNWENQAGAEPQDRELVECLQDAFLEQLVWEPTRDKAILDLVLCNDQDLISDLEVKEPLGGSDHNIISFYPQFEKDKGRSEVSVLQLNRGDYGAMREELAKVNWMDIPAEKTVEQQWNLSLPAASLQFINPGLDVASSHPCGRTVYGKTGVSKFIKAESTLKQEVLAVIMACREQDVGWSEETICSICLEFFTEPVSLECGHSFCFACITQCQERKSNFCPECRAIFPARQLRINRALAKLAERARELNLNLNEEENNLHCEEHEEELKLFCETDKKLICLICRDALEHREHHFRPIKEAVEIQKAQIKTSLVLLMEKNSLISETERKQIQKIREIRAQSHSLQDYVTSEFDSMHQFLNVKEQEYIRDLKEQEKRIRDTMEETLRKIQDNLHSIQEEISNLQKRMKEKSGVVFLKKEIHCMNRGSNDYEVLPVADGALSLEKFGFTFFLAWKEMSEAINPVAVALDAETANRLLEVSDDLKAVRWTRRQKTVPDTRKRFTVWPCVLGSEGYTSGRHYWEVDVAGNRGWGLGVVKESVERKQRVDLAPENGFWIIRRTGDGFNVPTSPESSLPAGPIPGRVGVYLSYESGTVSFYNAETKSHLHTFTGNKFTEKLYPFFWTLDENSWLKI